MKNYLRVAFLVPILVTGLLFNAFSQETSIQQDSIQAPETDQKEDLTIGDVLPRTNSSYNPIKSRRGKYDRGIKNVVFVPKGQWLTGMTFSYSEHTNDNYKFLLLDDWSGKGYNFKVSPFFAYFFKENMAVGGRFSYDRSLLQIDEMKIALDDDLNIIMEDVHNIEHTFSSTAFIRNYLSIGDSKRFGLFTETRLTYGFGQSKSYSKNGEAIDGTFTTKHTLEIGVVPGMVAFINDFAALEVSVGLLGFKSTWIDQNSNQVEDGSRQTNSANFSVNILQLNIGVAFYL
ncbi:hypothetical protein [Aureibacter tunicatorum]|uniref:Outer membrane protein beta-barrel domain-containing protein n=1 Tax=Aureibacter tunicatorum TaxID=866807 RepID=A0AAE3XP34_9BACT|nr:hypothetical protein [Aureibacter tunicatorum]MDR6239445.1 hypothetical protein [Aureibacter tunicatorum]BDD04632.1 hypothetical protein AUTU_21150 [Aureibacter tunicatorum]